MKVKRSIKKLAIIFTALSLLVISNAAPIAAMTVAWGYPELNEPKLNDPDINEPTIEAPDIEEPTIQSPEISTPNINTPNINSPEQTTPAWTMPKPIILDPWEIQEWKVQQWELQLKLLEGGQNGNQNGSSQGNQNNDGNSNNEEKPSNESIILPGGSESGDDSSSDSTGPSDYDKIKFLVNDVVGSTANFITDPSNQINHPMDLLEDHRAGGRLTTQLAFSVYKVGVKGNASAESIGDTADGVLKTKETYGKLNSAWKFRQDLQAALSAQGTLQDIEHIDDVNAIRNTIEATHFAPVSKLNVGVAAVSAGFSAYETGQNIGKFISADSGEERLSSGFDTLSSLGDTIMNVSVVSAAVPGAQAAAAIAFAVGAGIWAIGTVGKLWMNREKIVSDAKNLWRSAKEGVKNSWNKVKGVFGF